MLIDSHSKWIDVENMTSTTTERTIDELRLIFAKHGLPEQLVSDNGPQFTSEQFPRFTRQNGIKHILVPPYHPASNGAAERLVCVVKEALEKQVLQGTGGMTMKHRLANFLIKYCSTPHSVTGQTPNELMVKRQLRTRLTLLKPNLAQVVENKHMKQKLYHHKSQVERGFMVNEPVRVRITDRGFASQSAKWSPGVVLEVCGDRWYLVQMGAVTRRVHADHFIRALDNQKMSADLGNSFEEGRCLQEFQSMLGPVGVQNQEGGLPGTDEESSQSGVVPSMSGNDYTVPIASSPVAKETEVEGLPEMTLSPSEPLRRSTRIRKPVVRLNL